MFNFPLRQSPGIESGERPREGLESFQKCSENVIFGISLRNTYRTGIIAENEFST